MKDSNKTLFNIAACFFLVFLALLLQSNIYAKPNKGAIWSLVELEGTSIQKWWVCRSPELKNQYPGLVFVDPDEIHITVVGLDEWTFDDFPRIAELALVAPEEPIETALALDLLGKNHEWLVLRLVKVPLSWKEDIRKSKTCLVKEGLRKASQFDNDYIPHISLATLKNPPKPPFNPKAPFFQNQMKELCNLQRKLEKEVSKMIFCLSPKDAKPRVVFWLTGATRPPDYVNYISLKEWMKIYMPKKKLAPVY